MVVPARRPCATRRRDRHADRRRRLRCTRPREDQALSSGSGARRPRAAHCLGLHRRLPARRAGLLDGRRATTHWAVRRGACARYPAVGRPRADLPARWHVWTSAGVTAGMDLALALVEEDLDREAALTIARHLVLFLRRPGNQSQFSATLAAQQPEREPLREAQRRSSRTRRGPVCRGHGRARAHEPAPLRRAFRAETASHQRATSSACAWRRHGGAGGHRRAIGAVHRGLRLRHGRDHAPRRSCARSASPPPSTAARFQGAAVGL